jgi:uncharacterized membrane protein
MQPYKPQYRVKTPAKAEVVLDRSAERVLSALAHGVIAFGFFGIGFLVSLAISGVIWLYSRRSPQVRFHAEQAGCYQCSVLLINVVAVLALGLGGGFSIFQAFQHRSDWGVSWGVVVGLIAFGVWFVGTILYGLFAAVMVLLGRPFKYPIIGDRMTRKT